MTLQEKLNLVTNYFAEDWAIDKAMQLLEDYENAQQPAPSAAGADGWKLVPVKETPEMLTAVYNMVRPGTWLEVAQTVWRTMVNAAPQPSPTPQADESPIPADYGGEPRIGCGLEGAHQKIEWIANTAYAMRNMHTLDSAWRGQLITMAAAANFVAKQIAALEPTPQTASQPAPVRDYPPLPEPQYQMGGKGHSDAAMRAYVDADRKQGCSHD